MHPDLNTTLCRLEDAFRADVRCLGMYLRGSVAAGAADAYSDVDFCVVVGEADYAPFKAELRALCASCCGGEPVAWFCKSERDAYTDYAVLFESRDGAALLALDLSVNTPWALEVFPVAASQFVFARDGLAAGPPVTPPAFSAAEVRRLAEEFWSHAYLNGKYLRRGDLFKLLTVQRSICDIHLRVLNARYSPLERWAWWAGEVKRLPAAKQREMLVYFGAASVVTIAAALRRQTDLFAEDARAACEIHGADYPAELEARVRRHLEGALRAAGDGTINEESFKNDE